MAYESGSSDRRSELVAVIHRVRNRWRLKLALRGAAIAAAVIAGLPVSEYTAGQVKQAVVGAGRALKPQVQEMVRRLLSLPGIPASDAADALAAAICHAHASTGVGALARHGYRVRGGRLLVT